MITVRGIAALAVSSLLLTACGVPAQDQPHPVTLPRRPLDTTSIPAATDPAGEVAQVLCLINGDRLVQTGRRVRAASGPQQQLDQLVAGPTAAEQAQGISTALAATELTVNVPAGSFTAAVEISEPDDSAARNDAVLAYGQIVCTLTARADIAAVSFQRDGQPLQVPRGDGTLTGQALRASDYRSLIGPA
jgi:hypothetical protein